MTAAVEYRKIAAELRARARLIEERSEAAELNNLALSYIRLAEAAEQNSTTDIAVEFGPPPRLIDGQ